MRSKKFVSILVLLITVLGLTACSFGSTKKGWVGNNYPGNFNASFNLFTGTESSSNITLNSGEFLEIEYNSVIESGELEIKMMGPDDEKVSEININEKGVLEIAAETSGKYQIIITADMAKGIFSFTW